MLSMTVFLNPKGLAESRRRSQQERRSMKLPSGTTFGVMVFSPRRRRSPNA
jgi:hypothetical protein